MTASIIFTEHRREHLQMVFRDAGITRLEIDRNGIDVWHGPKALQSLYCDKIGRLSVDINPGDGPL
jgi:hypothetical protein